MLSKGKISCDYLRIWSDKFLFYNVKIQIIFQDHRAKKTKYSIYSTWDFQFSFLFQGEAISITYLG